MPLKQEYRSSHNYCLFFNVVEWQSELMLTPQGQYLRFKISNHDAAYVYSVDGVKYSPCNLLNFDLQLILTDQGQLVDHSGCQHRQDNQL